VSKDPGEGDHLSHGRVGYLQLPARDVARSAGFYESAFGWSVGVEHSSFEAPGMIGQWTTDLVPADEFIAGPADLRLRRWPLPARGRGG
jgi:catechol 2,3-dioxygenase-like lactoylglutathione lyase family enzyme